MLLKILKNNSRKQLSQSVVSNRIAGRKISQNLPENTCAGVLFFINLQNKKIGHIHKKTPVPESHFQGSCRLEPHFQHQIINTHLHFFYCAADNKI